MSEYNADRDAERAKTARLIALRLAKEATYKEAETKQVTKTADPACAFGSRPEVMLS